MSNSSNDKDTNAKAESVASSAPSVQTKFLIRPAQGAPKGPLHWKLIVEWYELGLIDEFSYDIGGGEYRPVSDLADRYGIPPTIGMNSIFLAPSDGAPKCPKALLAEIQQLGFPETSLPVNKEQAEHIAKRLKLSDEALDAEDPKFRIKSGALAPSTPPVEQAPELDVSETQADAPIEEAAPIDPELDPVVEEVSPESNLPESIKSPVKAPEPAIEEEAPEVEFNTEPEATEPEAIEPERKPEPAPKSPEPTVPSKEPLPESMNELLMGDLVGDDEEEEEDEPIEAKKSNKAVFLALVAALIVGGVIVYFISSGSDEALPETEAPIFVEEMSSDSSKNMEVEVLSSPIDEMESDVEPVFVASEPEVIVAPQPVLEAEVIEAVVMTPPQVIEVAGTPETIEMTPEPEVTLVETTEPVEFVVTEPVEIAEELPMVEEVVRPEVTEIMEVEPTPAPVVETVAVEPAPVQVVQPATVEESTDKKTDVNQAKPSPVTPVEKFPDYIPSF